MERKKAPTIMNFPNSSNVVSALYDEKRETLHVLFKGRPDTGRRTYLYKDVPPSLAEEFKAADSAGKFVHRRLKGKFKFRRLS